MKFLRTSDLFREVKIYQGKQSVDSRGTFLKPFFGSELVGLFDSISEIMIVESKKNVIRGMHFQTPPFDVDKIVTCIYGEIEDVVLDVRMQSNTFKKFDSFTLNSENRNIVFVPKGFAHGYKVKSKKAVVCYLQSGDFNEKHDSGVNLNSFGYNWKIKKPIISVKDQNLKTLEEFKDKW